jgi:hypothetical protein
MIFKNNTKYLIELLILIYINLLHLKVIIIKALFLILVPTYTQITKLIMKLHK